MSETIDPLTWEPSTWVAAYGAVVATIVAGFELWRWLTSGPRLNVRMMVNPIVITPGMSGHEKLALSVSVDNRGTASTTLTNLELHRYRTLFHRLFRRPAECFVIMHPEPTGHPPNLPSELSPGRRWVGWVRPRPDVVDVPSKGLFVAISTTHRNWPVLTRIPSLPKSDKNDAD